MSHIYSQCRTGFYTDRAIPLAAQLTLSCKSFDQLPSQDRRPSGDEMKDTGSSE